MPGACLRPDEQSRASITFIRKRDRTERPDAPSRPALCPVLQPAAWAHRTLWEGRFRSCLVEDERYLLICQRYIELNPVRAGMVGDPGHYKWSSYQANAFGADDPVVTPHLIYTGLGRHAGERRAAYRHLFKEALPDQLLAQIRHASNGNAPLGPKAFVDEISRKHGRPDGLGRRGRPSVANRNLPEKVL
jgi:putative transposase